MWVFFGDIWQHKLVHEYGWVCKVVLSRLSYNIFGQNVSKWVVLQQDDD